MNDINKYTVSNTSTIKEAVRIMDEAGIGFCVCLDKNKKILGVLTDGDFRRAVLNGESLDRSVENIINKDFTSLEPGFNKNEVERIFNNSIVKHIPIVKNECFLDIITEEKYFSIENKVNKSSLHYPVIIMAGGKGSRMDPFTRILPKPLIPLGNEPIIKVIMDEFGKFGMDKFYVSLNSKGRMIKAFFHDHEMPYEIAFIEEDKPLGTAGAIKLIQNEVTESFFVSNCDIIIHTDYASIVEFHKEGDYDLTLVASMRHYVIPYGVCDIQQNGELNGIQEKPEYDFLVNTGLYFMNPTVFKYIPPDSYFDMTDLIAAVKESGLRVGVFPVSEKSWHDVGQWPEYKASIERLSFELPHYD